MRPPLHVAVGVIFNAAGDVLLALRPEDKHQGGLWEFPGGKVEPGEGVVAALRRELNEELAIEVIGSPRPLITIHHCYPDRTVFLDVWQVERFSGTAHGREGQVLEWVRPERLRERSFPAANLPIVTALQLPSRYLITPDPEPGDDELFLAALERSLKWGITLVQLRAKGGSEERYSALARESTILCHHYGARLLLNPPPAFDACALLEQSGADGLHLTGAALALLQTRPLEKKWLLGASCHTTEALAQAAELGVDFALLSPVLATPTHPDAQLLGWAEAKSLVGQALLPVYLLGGMSEVHLERAYQCGAQGIAAIRGLWGGA